MSSAQDIRTLRNLSSKLVKCEERNKFFGNLNRLEIGVKEVEDQARRQVMKLENLSNDLKGKHRKKLISQAMELKKKDNWEQGKKLRRARNKLIKKIEDELGTRSRMCRWLRKSVRMNCDKLGVSHFCCWFS